MSLIPYHPFWDLDKWFFEGRKPLMKTPRVDIYETDKEVVAEVGLPGIDPKDIDIEVEENILKIEAKSEKKKEEKKKGYYRKELSKGYYRRIVPLPVEVVSEKAQASCQDGVLKITIPKAKPKKVKKTKKIKVKVKKA